MVTIPVMTSHIRKVNPRHDLEAVADLIEVCFASTLDDDGREYLRHLRWAARDAAYLSWLQGAAERLSSPLFGFVWEENGKIIGNLSLIPLLRRGKIIYLIANVAVHPAERQRGIARRLTETALDHLQQRGLDQAWLQVRDDNPPAIHLYETHGFVERARRTNWQSAISPSPSPRALPEGISICRRKMQDWDQHAAWLGVIYPPEVAWNLPLSVSRLSPDPLQQLMRWLRGDSQEHWVARREDQAIGYLSWEPMRSSADTLWLATLPQLEDQAIPVLLPYARDALARRVRPLSVNYPAGRAVEAFTRAGFIHHQTLIWMSVSLGNSNL